jgi:type I restriction enzyme M protein
MPLHKPSWFASGKIMVSTAPTCGLTKGGRTLPLVDPNTGLRVQVLDEETGEPVDAVNDKLLEDMLALNAGTTTDTLRFIDRDQVQMNLAVPVYYDRRYDEAFEAAMQTPQFAEFTSATLGDLVKSKVIAIRGGHGSPSADQRVGDVPYIKVSDLRAGFVNINPTNRVPHRIAERHWRGSESKLRAFDILCPERTSKNIGDFCVLMPGQERVLLTKEVIVLRPGEKADFDPFYILWAMTLKIVRDQWKRVVFMQTNREDVGKRYHEIRIPVPPSREIADRVSAPFRDYYTTIAEARSKLAGYLASAGDHHFFVSGAEAPDPEEQAAADVQAEEELREVTVPEEDTED